MVPKAPSATARTAAAPKRRPSRRSNVVGEPPRWRWPEDHGAHFLLHPLRDRLRNPVADSTQPVHGAGAAPLDERDLAPDRLGALGHDDDAEAAAALIALPDLGTHLLDVEGDLGNEDHIGANR